MGGIMIFLTIMLIVIIVLMGWSLFLGLILSLILPFDLFEGSLLAMLASGIAAYVFINGPKPEDDAWENVVSTHDIPSARFFKSDEDKTWENWARYEIANAILYEFKQSLKPGTMTAEQLESLAIRLSGAAVAILKRKSPRATRFDVTMSQLRSQLKRMDQQPYDEDIMRVALDGINLALTAGPVEFAVRKKMWDQPAPLLDVE
jgi:hypothetical protein